MKKIIALMMILLIALPMALSQGNSNDCPEDCNVEQKQVRTQSKVVGLENAMLRVRNIEQKQHLERVMNMIQERHRERLQKLEGLEFDTDIVAIEGIENEAREVVIATGLEEKKFLGLFKVKRRATYEINEGQNPLFEHGQIMKRSRFSDFLFGDMEEN